jgi:hypothetical protein
VIGQLVFTEGKPAVTPFGEDVTVGLGILYNLEGKSLTELNFHVGVYQYQENQSYATEQEKNDFYHELVADNAKTCLTKVEDLPLDVFDYQQAVLEKGISYAAVRDFEQLPRLIKDPLFSLVFINEGVAIFQVNESVL